MPKLRDGRISLVTQLEKREEGKGYKMPYKSKQKYRDYMAMYMREQRRKAQLLREQLLEDKKRVGQLKKQFPDAYELLFGKKRRRK